MHDLCSRQEESAEGAMENPAGKEREEVRGPTAADPAGALRASVLGKRHHSLYEGLNGCEVGGFRKTGPGEQLPGSAHCPSSSFI
ncbi:hypothetical protein SKAU_G00329340 [Synaphobranchus kaupii]|uniref:Uncharacterized protein n=1 Tax=Synaphobranchus kaupii TaxID=118154 RepID=A0A9Q1IKK2_SYNKA|nr:hypothetical protein SKAU_G00329340 [Synaphobranchus kaupii]